MAFLVLALSQVFHAFNMRSNHSLFSIGFFTNKYLNGAALISIALIGMVVFIPAVASAFGMMPLAGNSYLLAVGLAIVPIIVLEISKAFGLVKHQTQ
jgi:Ca2+-transporting ATPase